MHTKQVILLFLTIFLINSCDTNEPPSPPSNSEKPTLELKLEDASCTEAWITLTTTNLQLPATFTLKQFNPAGDTISQILNLATQDSVLYIDSLMPKQTYQYQVSSIEHQVTSNELSVTTMDTTSHEFTFETFTFGGNAGSCTLYDVAIIDENNIWAVGDIPIADTSQNGYTEFNAVHWNGIQWELMRIPFLFQGDSFYSPIYAVFAFSADDIWFGIGNLIHWDGTRYFPIGISSVFPSLVNKIWGSSSSDLYVVGNNGNIVHYNGTIWQRIESGTELVIGDIWGIFNGNDGYNKYLAAVNTMLIINEYGNLQRVITEQGHTLSSVWGISEKLLYTAGGNGLSLYKNNKWEKINKPDVNTIYNVRGQGHNDVFGLSSTFNLLHFNGYSWQYINIGGSNIYYRQEVKNELTVVVGWQGDKAVITVIRRNQ